MRMRDKGSRDASTVRRRAHMAEAYCVKDKKKVEVQNAQKITMKNGKPAIQGTCPECGGKVFRIGG
jgi:NAD-dependent SIR2 family protein deacetylase